MSLISSAFGCPSSPAPAPSRRPYRPRTASSTGARIRKPLEGSMNRFVNLIASALVLSWGTSPRASHRETPAPATAPGATTAEGLVQKQLIEPITARDAERSQFSRARLPPRAMRVRILDTAARTDGAGNAFVSFAVDEC